ncbi:Asp_protease_2 domain-containing protein [Cucumis melo var. makuwa]|uniref:Asp_protease_2 domain-containing protein n=1 Tax=Cucumis melo var. makuwa TaxID=1194695 RepID=A0A5D3DV75_CUCMM|nr:Asp_protease_2 domain-containing protein [Cucumis melo var. makuwa]TYK27398.1 Asp_protease_2 domain-containing protein [Cucumis melo var. makuwa]
MCPIILSIVSYVRDHTWPENVRAKLLAFHASLASDSYDKLGQTKRKMNQTEEGDNTRMGALKVLSSLQKKEKDTGKMKAVNSAALPIVGLVKQTVVRLGGWNGLVDFVVVKIDDFDVVLGMEFLLEHHVISMPLPNTMQLKKGLARDEPTFMPIPLDSSENPGETVPKDILCVLEKYRDVMPGSLPKSLSP